MKWLIPILLIGLLGVVVMGETSMHYLTKGQADRLYCAMYGTCTIKNLIVTNRTTINESYIINLNITGNLTVQNISADNIFSNNVFVNDDINTTNLKVSGTAVFEGNVIGDYGFFNNINNSNHIYTQNITVYDTLTAGDLVWDGNLGLGWNNLTQVSYINGINISAINTSYVPYTGAIKNVNLGLYGIIAGDSFFTGGTDAIKIADGNTRNWSIQTSASGGLEIRKRNVTGSYTHLLFTPTGAIQNHLGGFQVMTSNGGLLGANPIQEYIRWEGFDNLTIRADGVKKETYSGTNRSVTTYGGAYTLNVGNSMNVNFPNTGTYIYNIYDSDLNLDSDKVLRIPNPVFGDPAYDSVLSGYSITSSAFTMKQGFFTNPIYLEAGIGAEGGTVFGTATISDGLADVGYWSSNQTMGNFWGWVADHPTNDYELRYGGALGSTLLNIDDSTKTFTHLDDVEIGANCFDSVANDGDDMCVSGDIEIINNLYTKEITYQGHTLGVSDEILLQGQSNLNNLEDLEFKFNNGWTTVSSNTGNNLLEWLMSFKQGDNYEFTQGTNNDVAQEYVTAGNGYWGHGVADGVGSRGANNVFLIGSLANVSTRKDFGLPNFNTPTLAIFGTDISSDYILIDKDSITPSAGTLGLNGSLDVNGNLKVDGNFSAKRAYLMVSSNISEVIGTAEVSYPINFTHVEDYYMMGLEGKHNITFQDDGDYLVELSIIVQTDTNNKHVEVWPQLTNLTGDWENVPRSNTKLEIENAGTEQVISVPFILDIEAGTKFRLMWQSDDSGTMTVWSAGHGTYPNNVPETPSIIMTLSKISEITP